MNGRRTWPCRVWDMHQARCALCDGWAGEITSDRVAAAVEAHAHRRTAEHLARLADAARQAAKPPRPPAVSTE